MHASFSRATLCIGLAFGLAGHGPQFFHNANGNHPDSGWMGSARAALIQVDRVRKAHDGSYLPVLLPTDAFEPPIRRVFRVTAYCDDGLTAAGIRSGVGQCAAPAGIPFGAVVYLPALNRTFVVTDRTARRFRHNTVDIFIPERADCLEFGRNYLGCEIYLPRNPPSYGSPEVAAAVKLYSS